MFFLSSPTVLTNRIEKGFKMYGPVVRLWLAVFPFFVVFEPEHLQLILGSQKHTEKSFFYKLLHNFLGDGLITSSGDKWLMHRKLLTPTFHLTILEKFIRTFADSAQCLQDRLRGHHEINITSFINDCVLDILNGKSFPFTDSISAAMTKHYKLLTESILGVPIDGGKSKMENSPFRK